MNYRRGRFIGLLVWSTHHSLHSPHSFPDTFASWLTRYRRRESHAQALPPPRAVALGGCNVPGREHSPQGADKSAVAAINRALRPIPLGLLPTNTPYTPFITGLDVMMNYC